MSNKGSIQIKSLYKSFNGIEVLKDINHTFNPGTITTIIGPSGSGKSTLLRCINLLETPSSGEVLIDGIDITTASDLPKMRSQIGMVFQSFNLFENLSVLENCMIGQTKVLKRNLEEARQIAETYLEQVGLSNFKDRSVMTLSGGQQQRVAIARTLSMEPKIILFDEPTSSLDPEMVQDVLSVMKQIMTHEQTIVIVTHEMDFAKEVSDEIIFMDQGQMIVKGSPKEIFDYPTQKRLIKFIKK
jgi:putative lysine transport system ATP-binding protein